MLNILTAQAAGIALVNDRFRHSGEGVVLTNGVQSIPNLNGLMKRIRDFNHFTKDNDPYGEHDFGKVTWLGFEIFWKIDYYDQSLENWADPLSLECRRVITVMLAAEY